MKKHSSTYPIVFGIIFVFAGLIGGQILFSMIFGGIPIVIGLSMKKSEQNRELQTMRELMHSKTCCTRCGINLSMVPGRNKVQINNQLYCDVCGQKLLAEAAARAKSAQSGKKTNGAIPTFQRHHTCPRCKRTVMEAQTTWVGNYRFCRQCAQAVQSTPEYKAQEAKRKKTEQEEAALDAQVTKMRTERMQSLASVLQQICELKGSDTWPWTCSRCGAKMDESKMVYLDGKYCCAACYFASKRKEQQTAKDLGGDCRITYEIHKLSRLSLHERVVQIADRLLMGGFTFRKAVVGGGSSEVLHTGDMAYRATYMDYDAFKNNMERDFQERERREIENSDGWVTSMNYGYIDAILAKGTLVAHIRSQSGKIILQWTDATEKAFPTTRIFAEQILEEVFENEGTLQQIERKKLSDMIV